jgi:hypothetical protein
VTLGNVTGSVGFTLGGSSKVTFSGTVTGSESFAINNSAQVVFNGAVNTTGSFSLASSSILEFGGSDNANVSFVPSSSSTLKLDHSLTAPFTGSISGLASSNTIDLGDLTFVAGHMQATYSGDTAGGTLTVSNGTSSAGINLVGDYTTSTWTLSKDATGGTKVKDPPATSSGNDGRSNSLADLMSQFAGEGSGRDHGFGAGTTVGSSSLASNITALIESHTASPFAALSGGAAGLLTNPLTSSDPKAFLTHPSHA